jgi:hypothetical protein
MNLIKANSLMVLIILIFLGCCNSKDTNNTIKKNIDNLKVLERDTIEANRLSINGLKIGDSKEKLLKILGKSPKIREVNNEFQNSKFVNFVYENSNFSFEDNEFVAFEIKDSSFILDTLSIQIGQSIDSIKTIFPNSYRNYEDIDGIININVFVKDLDQHLVFRFIDKKLISFLLSGAE